MKGDIREEKKLYEMRCERRKDEMREERRS